jgi:hypothetical protein
VAIRGPARKNNREEMVACIHGIDPEGEVAHILVHKRGENVRFSGKLGEHNVDPSNRGDLEKWVREAQTVWRLDGAIGVLRDGMLLPETLNKLEVLNVAAEIKRKELDASGPLQT